MVKMGLTLAAAITALLTLALPSSASAAVDCDFDNVTAELDVQITNGTTIVVVSRAAVPSDEVLVDDDFDIDNGTVACTGATPTLTTTENIVVSEVGSSQGTFMQINFERGRLEPGLENESVGTSEIEVSYSIDGVGDDDLQVSASAETGDQDLRFGGVAGGATEGNLNGDGDNDITLPDGVDQIWVEPGAGADTITFDGTGSASFVGAASSSVAVFESAGDDTMRAGTGASNQFNGGLGDDTAIGGPGADSFHMEEGNDVFDGGGGPFDFASYENFPSVTGVTLDLGQAGPQDTVGFGVDQVTNVENVVGSNGPDRLTGTDGDNIIFGGNSANDTGDDVLNGLGGNDTLFARKGDDALIGGPGNDLLYGEEGSDTASFAVGSTGPVTFSLDPALTGLPQATGGAGTDTLADSTLLGDLNDDHEIENLVGSQFSDELTGNELENRIDVLDGILDTVDCGGNGDGDVAVADEVSVDALFGCETVDHAPQTLIDAGPADGATINDSTPTYSLTADEPSNFEYRADAGGFQACAGASCTVASLADGTHTLAFRAVDEDEHESADQTPAIRTVTVDTTAPQTIVKGRKRFVTRRRRRRGRFVLLSSETASRFECKLDTRAFRPCASPYRTPKLKRGRHVLRVRAIDAVDNLDLTPAVKRFRIVRKRRR